MTETLMTAAEVARRLQVNVETVYLLIQKDRLPAAKVGRQWRFEKAEVTRWLHDKMRLPGQTAGFEELSTHHPKRKNANESVL